MKNIVVRGSIPALNKVDFDKIKIPMPPLKLQEDIIEKLDKFTEYINLLNEELDLRQKQFEYYKNKLLTFGNDVLKVKLKEIGTVSMCKRVFKDQTSKKGEVPFYKIGSFGKEADSYISSELFEEYKEKYPYPKKGNVLISASGTIGKTVIYNGEKAYYQDSNIVWLNHDNTKVLDKYLYYFYNTFPWKITEGGTIPRLYNNNILNTELPLPTIEKQIEIVNILDKFEAICNVSLPEEIALREKQYEYYRDLLLSF